MLRPALRFLLLVVPMALAACDSSQSAPEEGEFVARVQGNSRADLRGAAVFATDDDARAPLPNASVLRAIILMEGRGGEVGSVKVAIYDSVRVGTYGVRNVGFSAGGQGYGGHEGAVTVTRVTDDVIEGEFEVIGTCCGSAFSGIPNRRAQARGRFSARRDPIRTVRDLNYGR